MRRGWDYCRQADLRDHQGRPHGGGGGGGGRKGGIIELSINLKLYNVERAELWSFKK